MKGAAGLELPSRFLQLHAATDNLYDICSRDQIVDEILRNQSGHKCTNGDPVLPGLWLLLYASPAWPRVMSKGVEAFLDGSANSAHISAASRLRLDLAHNLAHVTDAFSTCGLDDLVDHSRKFI